MVVVVGLFFASALLPAFTSTLGQKEPFKELFAAQSALIEHPSVVYAFVSSDAHASASSSNGTKTVTYLSARALLRNDLVSDAELARQLATILASNYADSQQVDEILIVLTYGYDIGIANTWSSYLHTFDPTDLGAGE
jgi:hypothetical protein